MTTQAEKSASTYGHVRFCFGFRGGNARIGMPSLATAPRFLKEGSILLCAMLRLAL
jgi:hypothetical protein